MIHGCCKKWRLSVNQNKTQILHFRKRQKPQGAFRHECDGFPLLTTPILNTWSYYRKSI